jgi:hypothetical protein
VIFIAACVGAGDALGDVDADGVACVTADELALFGSVVQAVPIATVTIRLKIKTRGSKLISLSSLLRGHLWGDD